MNRQATRRSNSTADKSRVSVEEKKTPLLRSLHRLLTPRSGRKELRGGVRCGRLEAWGAESRPLEAPVKHKHRRQLPAQKTGTSG